MMLLAVKSWWRRERQRHSGPRSLFYLFSLGWQFTRDSMPDRRRQRYGDMDYDWEFRMDTTAATVSWRSRLLGLLHSPYQPVEPELFHDIMRQIPIEHRHFTFIDIGSGKGRALMLAAEYPFERIVGVELLPELHHIAEQNIRKLATRMNDKRIELICGDATNVVFPDAPLVVYLFNPLPEGSLGTVLGHLTESLARRSRPAWLIYANPIFETKVERAAPFRKISGGSQYALFFADPKQR